MATEMAQTYLRLTVVEHLDSGMGHWSIRQDGVQYATRIDNLSEMLAKVGKEMEEEYKR